MKLYPNYELIFLIAGKNLQMAKTDPDLFLLKSSWKQIPYNNRIEGYSRKMGKLLSASFIQLEKISSSSKDVFLNGFETILEKISDEVGFC